MKIEHIAEATVPLQSAIRNAVIDFTQMTASAVAVVTDVKRGGSTVVGYGFSSNGRYAQGGLLRQRFIPRLLNAPASELTDESGHNFDPMKAWDVMMSNEKPGGHGERSVAVGALDMALWDATAKIEERPLFRVLADRFNGGRFEQDVHVYAAGGYYYPGNNHGALSAPSALRDELQSYLDQGYEHVKMKVGGASFDDDLRRIETALDVVGNGSRLAVDANARFGREEAVQFGQSIESFGLKWYEEPCDPLDFESLAAVSRSTRTPIATGENLFSMQDARNLVRYGGLDPTRDTLQMDPVLSYGLPEYLRTLTMLEQNGWSRSRCCPHGGHQFALHIAAGLGLGGSESYPQVFAPFGGFADQLVLQHGKARVPDAPGVGVERKADLLAVFQDLLGALL